MIFTETQTAAANGREVVLAALVEFDFASGPMHLWSGDGVLDLDGKEWLGVGTLGGMSAIPFGQNDSADKISLTLSGVDSKLIGEVNNSESVRGRDIVIYGLFFDVDSSQPLDSKFPFRTMLMDTIGYSATSYGDRRINLTAETIWTNRNLASFGSWSDRDQQKRYPGDKGLEFVSTLTNKRVFWPTF